MPSTHPSTPTVQIGYLSNMITRRFAQIRAAFTTGRKSAQAAHWDWGWAVRMDWPNGTHEIFGFTAQLPAAQRRLARSQAYWQRGPASPAAWTIVEVTRAMVQRHDPAGYGCTLTTCPVATVSAGAGR